MAASLSAATVPHPRARTIASQTRAIPSSPKCPHGANLTPEAPHSRRRPLPSPPASPSPASPPASPGKLRGGGCPHLGRARGSAGGAAGRAGRVPPARIKGATRRSGPPLPARRARAPSRPHATAAAAPAMGRQKELVSRCGEMLHIRYRLLRQALAECLGTLILVVSGRDPEKPFSLQPPHPPTPLLEGLFFKAVPTPLPGLLPPIPDWSYPLARTPSMTALTPSRMPAVTPTDSSDRLPFYRAPAHRLGAVVTPAD